MNEKVNINVPHMFITYNVRNCKRPILILQVATLHLSIASNVILNGENMDFHPLLDAEDFRPQFSSFVSSDPFVRNVRIF